MRALITGAGGQLGVELLRTAKDFETVGLSHSDLDIGDSAAVDAAIEHHRPDVVINAAAYNAVDDAEKQSDLAFRVNATAPGNLARAAQRIGARIIHISTDYVFDGKSNNTPYKPGDATNPLNTYGRSKLAGEKEVARATANHLVIRTSWLFSSHGRNFLQIILTTLKEGKTVRAVKDQSSVPTACRGLAEVIWLCAKRDGPRGIAHWVDRGRATRYDQAVAIREMAEHIGLIRGSAPIQAALASDFKPAAVRPRFSVMDASELSRQLGKPQRRWKDWLPQVLEEIYLK